MGRKKKITETQFCVLDVETTGLKPEFGHRVCELAVQVISLSGDFPTEDINDSLQVENEFQSLIDPHRSISPGAQRVNGITRKMVRGKPEFADLAEEILEILQGTVLVAHNAPFDLGFLASEFHIAGRDLLEIPVVDTCKLARQCFYFTNNKLDTLARSLNFELPEHRALSDVKVTSKILTYFLKELNHKSIVNVNDLIEAQGGPIHIPKTPTFDFLPSEVAGLLKEKKDVEIEYVSSNGDETNRRITLLNASQSQGNKYLIAYCHLREEQRTFRLDRIENFEL